MTYATQTIPGRLSWRHLVAAALVAVTIAVVTVAVVRLRDEPAQATRTTQGAPVATPELYALEELMLYARQQGLAGLSPASLTQSDAVAVTDADDVAVYDVYRDVARYAHANGMTGLSPASLAPAAQR
jgi:hypothetical protein